ncbi:MAG TPA: TrkA C-terminal domain-containing protein, partial [Burkholderiales bacterium]|nr:TrkA C-terminal domain-containing protein [Burkholderiales bacterium]
SLLVPPPLAGRRLDQSKITERTGLDVIAIQQNGGIATNPPPSTILEKDGELIMMGGTRERAAFVKEFGVHH